MAVKSFWGHGDEVDDLHDFFTLGFQTFHLYYVHNSFSNHLGNLLLLQGISHTATTIVRVAVEEHEKKGVTGAVGGVLRQIPPSIMQPFILATEATSNVLGGARNQLSPDARIEASKKWKSVQK